MLADDAPLSILADVAVGNARSAHSGESVSVVLCPTVVDTLVVLLELRHWADGRISSCKASSKAIGFMSLRTGHHTGSPVQQGISGTNSQANSALTIEVLAILALTDPSTLGICSRVECESFNAASTVGRRT